MEGRSTQIDPLRVAFQSSVCVRSRHVRVTSLDVGTRIELLESKRHDGIA